MGFETLIMLVESSLVALLTGPKLPLAGPEAFESCLDDGGEVIEWLRGFGS